MALSDMHAEAVAGIVDRIVARYHRDPTCMVQILREIQEACDWISPEAIDRLQTTLGVPRTKIEGVAGFYSFLYTEPRGQYRVLFSDPADLPERDRLSHPQIRAGPPGPTIAKSSLREPPKT